jgi:2-oxoglutarate/2-oxoacid ferredoxin oxidoreductase subunit alpha
MKQLWKGNLAFVEGSIAGGLQGYFGYPITPQNEITEYMSIRMRQNNRVFLQAESELASIYMVLGGAALGKRVMTTSSSPGMSLMQEGISYLIGCELPAVIANVQRGGPGLGNISGAQGDYFQTVKGGGHGDYKMIVLAPSTVQEMYDMARVSFDLAFKYRNPVMILSDGVLGQMVEPADIEIKKVETCHGMSLQKEIDLGWNLGGCKNRESRFIRSLLMGEGELEEHNYKLNKKFIDMEKEVMWEERDVEDADIVLVGYGTSSRINMDVYKKAKEKGLKVGYFKLKTLYPFPKERLKEIAKKSKLLVVEMSLGQLVEDVKLSLDCGTKVGFCGRPGGGVPKVDEVLSKIEDMI